MNKEWNAKRDLSPEDFEIFSRQHLNDLHNARVRLAKERRDIAAAEERAKWYGESICRTLIDMRRHGIEVPE